jgi:hypothetical protein
MHRIWLAEHDALQRFFERAQPLAIRRRRLPGRDPGNPRDDALDVRGVDNQGRRLVGYGAWVAWVRWVGWVWWNWIW